MKLTDDELDIVINVLEKYSKILKKDGRLEMLSKEDAQLYQDILLLSGNIYLYKNGVITR